MSIERYLQSPHFQRKLDSEFIKYEKALRYINGSNDGDNLNAPEDPKTVFEAGMPGALTLEEVREKIDLDHWKVMIGDRIVELEVRTQGTCSAGTWILTNSQDLVSWDEHDISEPESLKGIVAELAACIGPGLVRNTILSFI